MPPSNSKKIVLGSLVLALIVVIFGIFIFDLRPVSEDINPSPAVFTIKSGDGFRKIIANLASAHLVRSVWATDVYALLSGTALQLKPGEYKLDASLSMPDILGQIATGAARTTTVLIPEGSNVYQIDAILSSALVINQGDLIALNKQGNLEGELFPDTYEFFIGSDVKDVVKKMQDNFVAKVGTSTPISSSTLILASLVEKEVPDPNDQKLVAGVILKRIAAGMPLDIDATICYLKLITNPTSTAGCYPITVLDKHIDSPYNTYLHKGLPPDPIGNPGIAAISASENPESSPYWYYLSDPKTGKTIFAKTLDEQDANRVKYLKGD